MVKIDKSDVFEHEDTYDKLALTKSDITTREYTIDLIGCDDTTSFSMSLSDDEVELLKRVSRLSKKVSGYPCMPILEIC